MKKLYNKFFYVPKHGKVSEKVMLVRSVFTLVTMVVCLTAMTIAAYAYFSTSITSSSNIIKSANFKAQIAVTDTNGATVSPSSVDKAVSEFNFTNPGTYTVKLTKGDSSADTGFCIVTVGEDKYYTQQIGTDVSAENGRREAVKFELQINEPIIVKIGSHWGTSSHYNLNSTSLEVIVVGNPTNSAGDIVESTETITPPVTSEPETTVPTEQTPSADTTETPQANETQSTVVNTLGESN